MHSLCMRVCICVFVCALNIVDGKIYSPSRRHLSTMPSASSAYHAPSVCSCVKCWRNLPSALAHSRAHTFTYLIGRLRPSSGAHRRRCVVFGPSDPTPRPFPAMERAHRHTHTHITDDRVRPSATSHQKQQQQQPHYAFTCEYVVGSVCIHSADMVHGLFQSCGLVDVSHMSAGAIRAIRQNCLQREIGRLWF